MEKSIKGLLLYPPIQFMDVETPRPDGSLGLLYLASALESQGIETDLLDASVGDSSRSLEQTFYRNVKQENGLTRIGMSFEEIAEYVNAGNYDFVGVNSNFTPQTRMVFETAKAIKKASPQVRIYSGGVNARALKERFIESGLFEGICLSEGEIIFPRMIEAGAKGKTMDNIPGVAFCHSGKVIVNPADDSCFPEKLDDLAMPAWEKLPFEKYGRIASPHGVDLSTNEFRYAPMMTSRGCRFQCAYCHISREKEGIAGRIGRLRYHSIDRVIKETEKLKSLGVEKLFMEDDSLLSDKERMKLIIGCFERMGLNLANVNGVNIADFFNKENGEYKVDENFVKLLKQAGFEQIVFPVESGSQRILKKYATNKVLLDRMDVVGLMKDISDHKIFAPVNMMIGFPDEDEKEIQESIALAKKLRDAGAPYVTFFIPIPFPGSKLYDIAIAGGHLEQNFNPDLLNWKRAVMENTKVSPERIEEIRDRANEEVNSEDHLRKRLENSVGFRWTSGNQNQK